MSCDFGKEYLGIKNPFSFGKSGSEEEAAKTFHELKGYIPPDTFRKQYIFDDTVKPHSSGTFGQVFFGLEKKDPSEKSMPIVVKKIYSKPTTRNPNASLDAILREVQVGMSFNSPHLCKVYGFSVDEAGFVYIAMEHIHGMNAFDFFKENLYLGKTNPCLAKKILHHVARGLATLHEADFVHRDFKPDNIMLEFNEAGEFVRAVIIDFGFTMRVCDIPHGSLQCSICYSAPEILKCGRCTEKVDIWAFGVMVFVILHGCYPIRSKYQNPGLEFDEVFQKLLKLTESPELPIYTEGNKDVNDLRMICARCLEFVQDKRISAEELLAMLSQ